MIVVIPRVVIADAGVVIPGVVVAGVVVAIDGEAGQHDLADGGIGGGAGRVVDVQHFVVRQVHAGADGAGIFTPFAAGDEQRAAEHERQGGSMKEGAWHSG